MGVVLGALAAGCGKVPSAGPDANATSDATTLDAHVDALTVTVSRSSFTLHVNDTRETKITVTNGTTQAIGTPSLQVMGLTLGTLTFTSNACTAELAPGTSCTATAQLTAIAAGQVNFNIVATGAPGGSAVAELSAAVMPACPANCGATGNVNCCASSVVPGNATGSTLAGMPFYRSYDVATDGMYSTTANPATVSDFRLDTYEATVGRFRQFVQAGYGTQAKPPAAGAGAHPNLANSGWNPTWNARLPADTSALATSFNCGGTWTATAGANEALPMSCVTWYVATAFCIWDGGYLPTEAEWNYAASGGSEQRAYPWSSPAGSTTIDCSYANHYNNGTTMCVNPPNGAANRVGSESPKGDGRWGHADLGDNVSEWTLDSYDPSDSYPSPCSDCANLTDNADRVRRGGAYGSYPQTVRVGLRGYYPPAQNSGSLGVRCARAP